MRYIILVAGLLISISAGMWDRVSAYDIFLPLAFLGIVPLTLVFLGIIFELGSGSGSESGGTGFLPDSSDGDSGSDWGGADFGDFF